MFQENHQPAFCLPPRSNERRGTRSGSGLPPHLLRPPGAAHRRSAWVSGGSGPGASAGQPLDVEKMGWEWAGNGLEVFIKHGPFMRVHSSLIDGFSMKSTIQLWGYPYFRKPPYSEDIFPPVSSAPWRAGSHGP